MYAVELAILIQTARLSSQFIATTCTATGNDDGPDKAGCPGPEGAGGAGPGAEAAATSAKDGAEEDAHCPGEGERA